MEFERLQQDCIQATEAAIEAERTVVIIKTDHAITMKSLKTQHKYAIRDTQARHVLRFEKQKLSMTNEMNSLHDLIFGQNQMIDGCLLEMQKSICLSGSIIAEDSTVEEISRSIIESFGKAGQLL